MPVGTHSDSGQPAADRVFKKGWWPGGDWKHYEPFPIPLPTDETAPIGKARYIHQRSKRRRLRQQL
eukprot:3213026-Karenia_brevis.AAC.1